MEKKKYDPCPACGSTELAFTDHDWYCNCGWRSSGDVKIDEKAWIAAWMIQAEQAEDFIEEPDGDSLYQRSWLAEIISDVMSGMLPAEGFVRRLNLERKAHEKEVTAWNTKCGFPPRNVEEPEYPVKFPDPEDKDIEEGNSYPLVRLGTTPQLVVPRKKRDSSCS